MFDLTTTSVYILNDTFLFWLFCWRTSPILF